MNTLHKKQKGNIGELAVAADLSKRGLPIFKEFGDLSKVDLITIFENRPIKIQVKARSLRNGVIEVESWKSGPNYRFKYVLEDIDVFAVYCLDTGDIGYMLSKDFVSRTMTSFRVLSPKNQGKQKSIRWLKDYNSFTGILRGHTSNTQTDKAVGEEMVQTTTVKEI